MKIRFGTSGWRGLIARDVTVANMRLLARAVARFLKGKRLHNRPLVVGYDTRFLSEIFAKEIATVLASEGLEVHLTERDTPTPVIAFHILREKAAGGLIVTASHNPYDYSGLKFSESWGGPALPETTQALETLCEQLALEEGPTKPYVSPNVLKKLIIPLDPQASYLRHIRSFLQERILKKARLDVAVDPLYGSSRGYLDELLENLGCRVHRLHGERNVLFGGRSPDPSSENLEELIHLMKKERIPLGLATDGDGDRFGVVDADGTVLSANEILALLLEHWAKTRRITQGLVVRSVMSSHFIDAVARRHGLEVQETPVGFKYIGEIMAKEDSVYPERKGRFVMGGEESGGLSLGGHVPEKDGILACLLVAELVASEKKPLKALLLKLQKEVGGFLSQRLNWALPREAVQSLRTTLAESPPTEFGNFNVRRIVELDGYKFILTDGSWVGIRVSGTEPVVRVYLESSTPEKLKAISQATSVLIKSFLHETPGHKKSSTKKAVVAH